MSDILQEALSMAQQGKKDEIPELDDRFEDGYFKPNKGDFIVCIDRTTTWRGRVFKVVGDAYDFSARHGWRVKLEPEEWHPFVDHKGVRWFRLATEGEIERWHEENEEEEEEDEPERVEGYRYCPSCSACYDEEDEFEFEGYETVTNYGKFEDVYVDEDGCVSPGYLDDVVDSEIDDCSIDEIVCVSCGHCFCQFDVE